jgi:hypothetical protein
MKWILYHKMRSTSSKIPMVNVIRKSVAESSVLYSGTRNHASQHDPSTRGKEVWKVCWYYRCIAEITAPKSSSLCKHSRQTILGLEQMMGIGEKV